MNGQPPEPWNNPPQPPPSGPAFGYPPAPAQPGPPGGYPPPSGPMSVYPPAPASPGPPKRGMSGLTKGIIAVVTALAVGAAGALTWWLLHRDDGETTVGTTVTVTATEPTEKPTVQPTKDPNNWDPDAPTVEEAAAALANPDLVWLREYHDPGGRYMFNETVSVDGTMALIIGLTYFDEEADASVITEGLYQTQANGSISELEVWHATMAFGTREYSAAECAADENCVVWTERVPYQMTVLRDLVLAAVANGGYRGAEGSGWIFDAGAGDLPEALWDIGVEHATVSLDEDTYLPKWMDLDFNARTANAVFGEPYLGEPPLSWLLGLGEPEGLSGCVSIYGLVRPEAGTCQANVFFNWTTVDEAYSQGLFQLEVDTDLFCNVNEQECN